MIVQTKSFWRTIPAGLASEASIGQACEDVEADVNSFLSTLNPSKVLDVQTIVSSVGKGGIMVHVHSWITFRG